MLANYSHLDFESELKEFYKIIKNKNSTINNINDAIKGIGVAFINTDFSLQFKHLDKKLVEIANEAHQNDGFRRMSHLIDLANETIIYKREIL